MSEDRALAMRFQSGRGTAALPQFRGEGIHAAIGRVFLLAEFDFVFRVGDVHRREIFGRRVGLFA